ncbi:cyclin-dependent kinase inhibitor SMR3-like protein [Salvia divinorum]|uniref:Cyclin-dependent kinase inhibitor SMR3-like protein n=1 Tax=Salvia divinorum TaxID=28513 RepID=A0ABD1I673_SALDI
MGFSKKHQIETGKDSEAKKWVIAGIAIRAPLKPISIKPRDDCSDDEGGATPTARESRIPEKLPCPRPPRKRRPVSTCHFNGAREFFNPPELESIFMCHASHQLITSLDF